MANIEFEAWLRTVCFQKPTPEAYDLAKEAWICAKKQDGRTAKQTYLWGSFITGCLIGFTIGLIVVAVLWEIIN